MKPKRQEGTRLLNINQVKRGKGLFGRAKDSHKGCPYIILSS